MHFAATISKKHNNLFNFFLVICTIFTLILSVGCTNDNESNKEKVLNIGLLFGSGGLGDKSFNDSAYAGLLEAQKKYNIRFETVDYTNQEANLDALRFFAKNNYDLIIAVAYENKAAIETVANEYPNINFAAIDFEAVGDNIASIVYREQEADFLMGVLAAMLTKTKIVGVIGGTDIPAIRRIMSGFEQGVKYQDANVRVFKEFAGTFSDPEVGYSLALAKYNDGADVIHNAASKTGLGIIEAAKVTSKLTTGTSGDQRYLAPGNMVGNRPKRVDTAVLLVVGEVKDGNLITGTRSLGLKENGLLLGPFNETIVTSTMLQRLETLKQQIISGEIIVKSE